MSTIMVVVVQIKLGDLHELDDCTCMTLRNSAQHWTQVFAQFQFSSTYNSQEY